MAFPAPHPGPAIPRRAVKAAAFTLACAFTVWSAAVVKEGHKGPALMAVDAARVAKAPAAIDTAEPDSENSPIANAPLAPVEINLDVLDAGSRAASVSPHPSTIEHTLNGAIETSTDTRWFDGRPIIPSRVIWMTVTAYTPGAESCWPSDDGMTATLHSVTTNAGCLVAADTSILPFGSLVSIDGYDDANVVPVLDRGGKIRGHRLDLLMPSVPEARAWGVRRIPVIVWQYADGLPAPNPREVR